MFRLLSALALACACLTAVPADAQIGSKKSAAKADFAFPAKGPVKILVFRPDVSVGSQSAGGMNTPKPEWTENARKYLTASLGKAAAVEGIELVMMPEVSGEQETLLADYSQLFRAVTDAVVQHKLFKGNRLPTKKTTFNWTLGPGASKLAEIGGGDYGLFLFTYDSYGSTGRKVAQIFGAMMGVAITSGVHIGRAGLVDLRTGELVWANADMQMGGDVRDADGADKRVRQLLANFPLREGQVRAAAKAAAATGK
jgi:hypothetical protein